ncbi:MAG: cytochrome-c oxidase, cbb3-type subunit I [Myxococcales bacterium]|nr:cytochrome-c oxidase, cbb3-type subunit I [Myxococcales bacterium]
MKVEEFQYDDKIVRKFVVATVVWGVVGMLVGLIIAFQLVVHQLNFDLPFLTFGRLRPLHTNAVIFAFVGNGIFAGVYYSTQRLLKARMFNDGLSKFHFWGWQAIIVSAAVTLPLGITTSKEYAELEWPIDIAIAVVWVVFAINFFGTLVKRRERHLYVAIWFYIASIVAVALLHIVNSLALPVSILKSYSIYAGIQDALVQWWYGHNAVAFFLTTPYLGLMYYFMPKAAQRPVYSYRLSVVHFWSLVFLYMWAGPHHLLYTSLPQWAQTLGTTFSIMLIAPSWGGMINGLLTLRGAWDKLRTDPVLKFMVAAITFYGMSTFEGPMMSLKSVNALSHYTNWTIAHVHAGALGWNGFLTFGMLYWLVPRLWGAKQLHSTKMATTHFWLGLVGIGMYVLSMWAAGIAEGLMWKEFDADGRLVYATWADTLPTLNPMYWVRGLGGTLYFVGVIMMVVNLWKTAKSGTPVDQTDAAAPLPEPAGAGAGGLHRLLEGKPLTFTVLTTVAVAAGGAFEIIPSLLIDSNVPTIAAVKPYTPLELEGRDIYISEGCYNCHSQHVRPFRGETERYGPYSKAGEFVYDHPFQFGSRRIGPDLHRVGGKYPDGWHYRHMIDPRDTSEGSVMPSYPWLADDPLDLSMTQAKVKAMTVFNVPYSDADVANAVENAKAQAAAIGKRLEDQKLPNAQDKKIVALIAYLQRLGTDIRAEGAQ